MKSNILTTQYLTDRKNAFIANTEAFKAMTKKAAKTTALYGFMTLTAISGISCVGVYGVLKVQDFVMKNEFIQPSISFNPKVVTPHFQAREQAKTVLVQNDTLRVKVLANAKDKTLAQKIYDTFTAKGLDGQKAVAVSLAESGMDCNAVGINADSADLGLFQLNTKYQLPKSNLKDFGDCDKNLEYAANLVAEQGWGVFSSVNSGAYLRYMDTGLSYAGK